jgi:hypothetical protein
MRTRDLSAQGMGGEFNVLLAKVAGHFQVFWFAQRNNRLAVRAWDLLAEVLDGKQDVSTAGGTGDFQELCCLRLPAFEPNYRDAAGDQINYDQGYDPISHDR